MSKGSIADQHHRALAAADARIRRAKEEIVASLARDIHFDPRKLFDENGNLRPLHELDEDTLLALRRVEVRRSRDGQRRVVKFTFPDKTTACEQAMKYLGLR